MFKKDRERIAELDRRAKELLAEILAALDECPKDRLDRIAAFLDHELERLRRDPQYEKAFSGASSFDGRV
jgi:imidazoleglycerol phosphate dehydratase HisB